MSELHDLLTDISGKLDTSEQSLHDIVTNAAERPHTKDIPRGCFDANRFVSEGGDWLNCPYIDTATVPYAGQLATAQRVYINATIFNDYPSFATQAEAAKTAALFGDEVNGGSVIRTTGNILLSAKPAFLLEYVYTYEVWITWVNAAAATSESEFKRILRLAKQEQERRERLTKGTMGYVALAVEDRTNATQYPSRCNSICRRGCGYELVIY